MSKGRKYRLFWGLLFLSLIPVTLVILFAPDLISRSQFSFPYSTFRSDPRGSKALFLFGRQTGYAPRRITRPVSSDLAPGLFFSLNPVAFSPKEKADTLRWISQGGTYVLATDILHPLMSAFWVSFSMEREKEGLPSQRLESANPLTAGLSLYFAPGSPYLRTQKSPEQTGLEQTGLKQTGLKQTDSLILVIRHGLGRLIILSDPAFFGNQNLPRADNLIFLSRLLRSYGSKNLYFDEYHHGFTHDLSVSGYLWKKSLQFFLLQLLLVALGWIYLQRKSWGQKQTVNLTTLRPSADSIRAMARVYQRVGLSPETIQWLYDSLMPPPDRRLRSGEAAAEELEREKIKLTATKIKAVEAVQFTQKLVAYRKAV